MKGGNKKRKTLVAAMSGGVDSSVATAILINDDIDIIGVTLKFFDHDNLFGIQESSHESDNNAKIVQICEHLHITHYFHDMTNMFREKVLKKCWEEYSAGRTPNPCVLCNRHLKFAALLEYAKKFDANGIITGHYAKIAKDGNGVVRLSRADDINKDQSYFLSLVRASDLAQAFTPLYGLNKSKVRQIAEKLGLENAQKKESQDACIAITGENFAETLRKIFGGTAKAGNFLDESGKKIGIHNGIHKFTVGQRRGFGKGFGKVVFVKSINAESGDIILTENEEALLSKKLRVTDINWLMGEFAEKEFFMAKTQIRYRHEAAEAKIIPQKDSSAKLVFAEPQRAITPGQTAVFYDGNMVIGAGIISNDFCD